MIVFLLTNPDVRPVQNIECNWRLEQMLMKRLRWVDNRRGGVKAVRIGPFKNQAEYLYTSRVRSLKCKKNHN